MILIPRRILLLTMLVLIIVGLILGYQTLDDGDDQPGLAVQITALTVALRRLDAGLQISYRAHSEPHVAEPCPEDAVRLWGGQCVALDDLICGPGNACKPDVDAHLRRAGVWLACSSSIYKTPNTPPSIPERTC